LDHKTFKKYCFLIICLSFSFTVLGQKVKPIQNALDKNDFEKALDKITKNLKKDSLDAGSYYLYSMFYIHPNNLAYYHLDSAYKYVLKSLETYEERDTKFRYDLAEDGIRKNEIQFQKNFVDSTAYHIADSVGNLGSYQYFIDKYQSMQYTPLAITKRDSLAFMLAERQNTYQAYYEFISKYPDSKQFIEARKKYHDLLYKVKTELDDIESLENFIAQFPESPYLNEAQLRLFNIYTIDNEIATYEKFIATYPENPFTERAWKWIWYLHKEKEGFLRIYPQFPDKAFIYNAQKSDTTAYFPFYDDEKGFYGYMDRFGNVIIPAGFEKIPTNYLCEGVKRDYIIGYKDNKVGAVNLLGQQIAPFGFQEITELINGVLLTKKNNRYGLVHKVGFEIAQPLYQKLTPLVNNMISYSKGDRKGLLSYSGRIITQAVFDDIMAVGQRFIAIENDSKYAVIDKSNLVQNNQKYDFVYDDFELIDNQFLLLEQDGLYSLYDIVNDKTLFNQAEDILETRDGWILKTKGKYQIFNKEGLTTSPLLFDDIIQNQRSFGVKVAGKWGVCDVQGKLFLQPVYDTLYFVSNRGILLYEGKKKYGYFYSENLTDLSKYSELTIELVDFTSENSLKQEQAFIITKDKRGQVGALDITGKIVINNKFSKINAVSDNLFIVERYKKKGVFNIEGKQEVAIKYAGIVQKEDNFALLNNKKFGLYIANQNKVIDATFDMLLKPYGNTGNYIAKKGKYGIIDVDSKVLVDFQFDDLKFWTSAVALVKHQGKWKLYDLKNKYFIPEVFDTFDFIKQDEDEIIILTYRSSGYGVLSNKHGRIIPEEYSSIINMGTANNPLYFVERDVAQAGLYILLYIDARGEVVKKQVLKEEDYFKIACQDN